MTAKKLTQIKHQAERVHERGERSHCTQNTPCPLHQMPPGIECGERVEGLPNASVPTSGGPIARGAQAPHFSH